MADSWDLCDTTQFEFEIRTPPGYIPDINNLMLCNTQKTFDDIMRESVEPLKNTDEWLLGNIRKSIQENADIWSKLAKC